MTQLIKNITYILLCLLMPAALFAQQKSSQKTQQKAPKPQPKVFTVVIDAGHGGRDPGALGARSQEKTLNLDVALRLADTIRAAYPKVNVQLTRSTDVYLTLQERAEFVNKQKADLFICIHTNSAEVKSVTGAETFVLGVDNMQSNLSVAMRENSVMLLESNYKTTYEGFDPNSVESYIMFELMQDQYMEKSLSFATLVQQQFAKIKRANRGVRQAGFWVLHKSACPSVLVEMGFISNRDEELYLCSEKGKQEMTESLFNAFSSFKADWDKINSMEVKVQTTTNGKTSTTTVKTAATQPASKPASKPAATQTTAKPAAQTTTAPKPAAAAIKPAETAKPAAQTAKPAEKPAEKPAAQTAKPAEKPAEKPAAQTAKPAEKPAEKPAAQTAAEAPQSKAVAALDESLPIYRVQVFSTVVRMKLTDPVFKGLKDITEYYSGKYYRYSYGGENDYEDILNVQRELRRVFKDCFVVAFYNGEQIPVWQAQSMKK